MILTDCTLYYIIVAGRCLLRSVLCGCFLHGDLACASAQTGAGQDLVGGLGKFSAGGIRSLGSDLGLGAILQYCCSVITQCQVCLRRKTACITCMHQ